MSYKFRSPRKRTFTERLLDGNAIPIALLTLGMAGVSFGFLRPATSGTQGPGRVFAEGLSIKLDRTSPAYAALEDAWMTTTPSAPPIEAAAASTIGNIRNVAVELGNESYAPLAERIARENRREGMLIAQERASREAMSQFLAQAASKALQTMASHFENPPEPTKKVAKASAQDSQGSGEEHVTITKTISLTDLKMSREELIGSLIFPIASSAQVAKLQFPGATTYRQGHPIGRGGAVGGLQPPKVHAQQEPQGRTQKQSSPSFDQQDQPEQPRLRQVVISGLIEFTDGLALANASDKVVIYRDVDGEAQESGAVWLREARYEIFAEENTGLLVGELRTPYGDVIGRGSLEIAQLPITDTKKRRIENAVLRIKPVIQGVNGRVTGIQPNDPRAQVKPASVIFRDLPFEQTVRKDGTFSEPSLLEGSNAIVKATRPGYWGTLAFAHSGEENEIEIFPNQDGQIIHSLVALSRGRNVSTEAGAIIWGRVTKNGKPTAGAQVELMTTAEVMQPIYFNSAMVPDTALKETSANGLYAFFPVTPGAHAVQAVFRNGVSTEPQVFPTEERTVSRADIEVSAEKKAKVKVFDAFRTDYPLQAEIMSPGVARGQMIERGVGEIKYATGRGLLMIDSDAGQNYERVRIAMSRDRRVIYVPMVQTAWIQKLIGAMRINKEPQTGTVVGFVQGTSPYKIALEEKSIAQGSRIVYFNSRGDAIEQGYGEAGGGFVIFNVPEGFRTITVQPSGSTKIYSSVTLIEAKVTNVISHWIR